MATVISRHPRLNCLRADDNRFRVAWAGAPRLPLSRFLKRAEAWRRGEEKQRRHEAEDDARIKAEDPATRAERENKAAETQRALDNVMEQQKSGNPDDPTD